jgi:flagellar biogenesis protein FliO
MRGVLFGILFLSFEPTCWPNMAGRAQTMFRYSRLAALVLFVASAGALMAQSTPAPPDWKDNGTSVYLGTGVKSTLPAEQLSETDVAVVAPEQVTTARKFDSAVVPSAHIEPVAAKDTSSRHLAPPGARASGESASGSSERTNGGPRRMVDFDIPTKSLYTMGTGLTIVVGSFLLFAWVLRRSGRGRVGRAVLPAEVVSVLGRVSLSAKQMAQLLRVGNKLVLVAMTPNGAETLTEVTDPAEVDRLLGLCQQNNRHSTTQAFEQVFQSLSREPAANGFLGAESLPTSISPAAAAYRSHRGDGTRA